MTENNKISMPGGMGGLTRYDEKMNSKVQLSPWQVVTFLVMIILTVVGLHLFV